MAKKKATKAEQLYQELLALYPEAHCELHFSNPFELLLATILSAQCTDERVNLVTKELFLQFPSPKSYLTVDITRIEELIRSTGFFRQKARSLVGAAKAIVEKHGGAVPKTLEELIQLPGVGRKTANVVLGNAYNTPGLPVDTHVTRLSQRLGLTENSDPEKIEAELCGQLRPENWTMFSHLLIFHGRRVCFARRPNCAQCKIVELCEFYRDKNKRQPGS